MLGVGKRISMGDPEGERLLRRSRRRWEYNIETDVVEVGGCQRLD
jgi:hypothetical protein